VEGWGGGKRGREGAESGGLKIGPAQGGRTWRRWGKVWSRRLREKPLGLGGGGISFDSCGVPDDRHTQKEKESHPGGEEELHIWGGDHTRMKRPPAAVSRKKKG